MLNTSIPVSSTRNKRNNNKNDFCLVGMAQCVTDLGPGFIFYRVIVSIPSEVSLSDT